MTIETTDFPSLPQYIIDDIKAAVHRADLKDFTWSLDDLSHGENSEDHLGIDLIQQNVNVIGMDLGESNIGIADIAKSYNVRPPESVEEWVKANIDPDGIAKILVFKYGKLFNPHVDESRTYAFNCFVQQATDSKTVVWKAKERYAGLPTIPQTYIPYTRIEIEEEQSIPTNQWYRLDVSKIHSMEGIDPNGTMIILSVDPDWHPDY
jgi:hypothetical protein